MSISRQSLATDNQTWTTNNKTRKNKNSRI